MKPLRQNGHFFQHEHLRTFFLDQTYFKPDGQNLSQQDFYYFKVTKQTAAFKMSLHYTDCYHLRLLITKLFKLYLFDYYPCELSTIIHH